ncbi:putative damage-inducible protein DinB [Saonia flava]|uniref:Putative damage-inducible protein DinB n=1 Tax=Saonia flava TaxID=523696 RepID=A0A846QRK8_9FLAO|nr:DinB family protein [Saonia flava]NJB70771.1 putative damage-inducible protein DinB [Saonia flava]
MRILLSFLMFMSVFALKAQDNVVQSTLQGTLAYNQGQVVSLAEAFSEDQYDWRPSEGVRSVGESLLHIAGGNYYLASKMGFAPPADVDMMNIEKIEGKENIIATLKKSNEFVLKNIMLIESDKFGEEIDFGFAKMSALSGLLTILEHNGEHKGGLIAYARSNGVVPPWSK